MKYYIYRANDRRIDIANYLNKYMLESGYDVSVEYASKLERGGDFFKVANNKTIFLFDENDNFWLLDAHDVVSISKTDIKKYINYKKFKKLLKSQYRVGYYSEEINKHKIYPWIYFELKPSKFRRNLDNWRNERKGTKDKLFFKGARPGLRKKVLDYLCCKNVLENEDTSKISFDKYIANCLEYKLLISLPGHGNICHREIEFFGLGIPVLMLQHKNTLINPLIPDYHYISVPIVVDETVEDLSERILQRYYEVIKDTDYLNFVAENAIKWYDNTVRYPNCMKLTVDLLRLDK